MSTAKKTEEEEEEIYLKTILILFGLTILGAYILFHAVQDVTYLAEKVNWKGLLKSSPTIVFEEVDESCDRYGPYEKESENSFVAKCLHSTPRKCFLVINDVSHEIGCAPELKKDCPKSGTGILFSPWM